MYHTLRPRCSLRLFKANHPTKASHTQKAIRREDISRRMPDIMNPNGTGETGAQDQNDESTRSERATSADPSVEQTAANAENTNTTRKRPASDSSLGEQRPTKSLRTNAGIVMVDRGTSAGSPTPVDKGDVDDDTEDIPTAQLPPLADPRLEALRITDNQQDYLRSVGGDVTRLGRINLATIGVPVLSPDDVNVGDIIMSHDYERCLGPEDLRLAMRRLVHTRCQQNHGNVLFFGDPAGAADDRRPVIEKKRFFVVIQITSGTMICVPIYTHNGGGIPDYDRMDQVSIRDARFSDAEWHRLTRGLRMGHHTPVVARMLGDFRMEPAAAAKVNEVQTFSFAMAVVKIGYLLDEDTERFLVLTNSRGFNLFEPNARPVVSNISIFETVKAARDEIARNRRDEEANNRQRRNTQLTTVIYRGKFTGHPGSEAQFQAAFPNHSWGLINQQRTSPRTSALHAIVDSAQAQLLGQSDLHPSVDELQAIADEILELDHVMSDDEHYSIAQLREILAFWATSKRLARDRLKLGVWSEGPEAQVEGPWPAPEGSSVIWIWHNNLRQIFEVMQGRSPTTAENMSDIYRGITRPSNGGRGQEVAHITSEYARVVSAANPAPGDASEAAQGDAQAAAAQAEEDAQVEARVNEHVRVALQARLDSDPPTSIAIRLLGALLNRGGYDQEMASMARNLDRQISAGVSLQLTNAYGVESIDAAVTRVNDADTIAAAEALTQAAMAEERAARDQGNNGAPPPARPANGQNPNNPPPNPPPGLRCGGDGARDGAAGEHNGTPPPNAPNFLQGRGG
jgi:hypothetical protein